MKGKELMPMIVPAVSFLFLITVIPILGTIILSLFYYDITSPDTIRFYYFKHYIELFRDERFLNSVLVTLQLIFIPVFFQVMLGFLLAIAIHEKMKGTQWMRSLFLIPAVIPPVVIGLIWKLFIIPGQGGLTYFTKLTGTGFEFDFLNVPASALMIIIIASIWMGTPFVTLMFLSGLESISLHYYEAAAIDGAGWFRSHLFISRPLLSPIIKTVSIFRILEALAIFPIIFILTGGGPASATEPINFYAYITGFDYLKIDYAAAIIVFFFILLMTISLPLIKGMAKRVYV